MKPEDVRQLLAIEAIERVDTEHAILTESDRKEGAHAAGAPIPRDTATKGQDAFLIRRARHLTSLPATQSPERAFWASPSHGLGKLTAFSLIASLLGLVVGFLTNELGPEKRLNILSFPLLGILLWNALVYLNELVQLFRSRGSLSSQVWLSQLARGILAPPSSPRTDDEPANAGSWDQAAKRFQQHWVRLMTPVVAARIKSSLHLVALLLAAGAIGGMYLKGLSNEYRAIWESTFIEDGATLRPVLEVTLGPAAALIGDRIPSAEVLDTMRWQADSPTVAGQNAARWIHWYAITIGLFVILPRAILSLFWRSRAAASIRSLPYRETSPNYYAHLISVSSGNATATSVLPYGVDLTSSLKQAVETTLEQRFERAVEIEWLPSVAFGDEETVTVEQGNADAPLLLLYNFAATPERETHLALYLTLLGQGPNPIKSILLDRSGFDQKAALFPDAEARRESRELAWKTLFAEADVELVTLSSAATSPA